MPRRPPTRPQGAAASDSEVDGSPSLVDDERAHEPLDLVVSILEDVLPSSPTRSSSGEDEENGMGEAETLLGNVDRVGDRRSRREFERLQEEIQRSQQAIERLMEESSNLNQTMTGIVEGIQVMPLKTNGRSCFCAWERVGQRQDGSLTRSPYIL